MMLARGEMLSFCRGMTCGKARVQHIPLHSQGIASNALKLRSNPCQFIINVKKPRFSCRSAT